jgi:hypothetical protein
LDCRAYGTPSLRGIPLASRYINASARRQKLRIPSMPTCVTAQAGTEILGDKGGGLLVVSKELCYRKTETLEDAEEAARWWRYNLVR